MLEVKSSLPSNKKGYSEGWFDWSFHCGASHKTLKIKQFLAKKQKQNHPIPQWIQMITGNKIRYNSKRTHWRKTKLGL
ncbi:putative 60S ribosomal protein L39-like 5 [Lontra canadensis]|uniref:putative 60S ribosomal protein L39-like 5 n=1 Tax=Lontra canadensis TaxID=76717 RepID=UPI0013F310D1|nr:putative 60S ribosomal protein L39-like 5 [Lontra canadensis]